MQDGARVDDEPGHANLSMWRPRLGGIVRARWSSSNAPRRVMFRATSWTGSGRSSSVTSCGWSWSRSPPYWCAVGRMAARDVGRDAGANVARHRVRLCHVLVAARLLRRRRVGHPNFLLGRTIVADPEFQLVLALVEVHTDRPMARAVGRCVLVEPEADVARDLHARWSKPDHCYILRRDHLTIARTHDSEAHDQGGRSDRRSARRRLATRERGWTRSGLRPHQQAENDETGCHDHRRDHDGRCSRHTIEETSRPW